MHSLEHGAVWITYDADSLTDAEVERLREYVPGGYGLMSPYEGMDTPIAVSAWNAQLKLDSVDDSRIEQFFQAYWRSPDVPEPAPPAPVRWTALVGLTLPDDHARRPAHRTG